MQHKWELNLVWLSCYKLLVMPQPAAGFKMFSVQSSPKKQGATSQETEELKVRFILAFLLLFFFFFFFWLFVFYSTPKNYIQ